MLDLSVIVNSEEFNEPFVLVKTTEGVDTYGRLSVSATSTNIKGVITASSGNNLVYNADYQLYKNFIEVTSTTPLLPLRTGYQADIVQYKGDNYKVLSTENHSSYGFYSCIAGMINTVV